MLTNSGHISPRLNSRHSITTNIVQYLLCLIGISCSMCPNQICYVSPQSSSSQKSTLHSNRNATLPVFQTRSTGLSLSTPFPLLHGKELFLKSTNSFLSVLYFLLSFIMTTLVNTLSIICLDNGNYLLFHL